MTGTCQSCHSTDGWKRVRNLSSFNHSTTKFPLLGKHREVGCLKCHLTSDFKKPVPHAQCVDCHKADDPHKGQFVTRTDKGECAACHNEKSFKPSTFLLADHQKIEYRLVGKHESIACEKCHAVVNKVTQYRMPHGACKDCHPDAHSKQFSNYDRCESCHNEKGFKPSTYLFSQHQSTRFPLAGAHGAIICNECHKPAVAVNLKSPTKFHWDDITCTGCHEDPHQGQLATGAPSRSGRPGWNCTSCHNDSSWGVGVNATAAAPARNALAKVDMAKTASVKRAESFDHAATDFKLTGPHANLTCAECHRPAKPELGIKSVVFRDSPKECRGCHEDIHGGQFDAPGRVTRCESCHVAERWKPSKFDHFSPNTFSLAGAHEFVHCNECHTQTRNVAGKAVLVYKGTPSKCDACHADEPAKQQPEALKKNR
jgi:hypothetical protein